MLKMLFCTSQMQQQKSAFQLNMLSSAEACYG